MGKNELQQQQEDQFWRHHESERNGRGSSRFFCERCSMTLSRQFNLRCIVVLILSLSVFLSGIFWILPLHSTKSGFDAKAEVKLSATVQASFRLPKPVLELVPQIERLEYDIFGEIGVPQTKVAILSMHQIGASNWTDVVFGVLSDPINVEINPVSLSVLKSSLVELFRQDSNLTLTTSIFGQSSKFEILKFRGGITVIPKQSASIWAVTQSLFNFTLINSINEVQINLVQLKDQLKSGLHLRPYENVYVQLTNKVGSTVAAPVIVQAYVMSGLGSLLPPRLKQLAQTITNSSKNLGLDNSVFGRVKSISLSSYLKGTLHANPPTPSPAPSPKPSKSPYPPLSPSHSPGPSPGIHHHPPCFNCRGSPRSHHRHRHAYSPRNSPDPFPPSSASPAPSAMPGYPPQPCQSGRRNWPYPFPPFSASPAPSAIPSYPHQPCAYCNPTSSPSSSPYSAPVRHSSHLPYAPSPLPEESFGPRPGKDIGNAEGPTSPSLALLGPSPSSSAASPFNKKVWLLGAGLLVFHFLCWIH